MSILPHSSEESYQRYHLKTPYFEEMFAVIEKCPGANGPTRVGTYIAKKHKEVFANVGKANGYNYGTKMDEIASAAMWRDARVLDWQAETVLRHLRYHFEEDITVPFRRIFTLLDGMTQPRTKSFEHQIDGETDPEMIHAQYQDVSREYLLSISELLEEHSEDPFAITSSRLVIGGDHGQGAFRLVIRTILLLEGREEPLIKTKSVAEVYCKREEGIVLEATIIDWLKEELTLINDSKVLVKQETGAITCSYSPKSQGVITIPGRAVIQNTIQLMAGDLCWFAYCLGKEGSSSSWCPYCPLSQAEWSVCGHNKASLWTIDALTKMDADSTKTGPEKKGVKCAPIFPHIEPMNYVLDNCATPQPHKNKSSPCIPSPLKLLRFRSHIPSLLDCCVALPITSNKKYKRDCACPPTLTVCPGSTSRAPCSPSPGRTDP